MSTVSRRALLSSVASLPLPMAVEANPRKTGLIESVTGPAPDHIIPQPVWSHFGSHYRDAIEAAMQVLTRNLEPNAGTSDREALSDVLGILDDENLVRALRARPIEAFIPAAGMMVHDGLNDTWFTLTAEMADDMRRTGIRELHRGTVNWDGLILDGWLPASEPAGA